MAFRNTQAETGHSVGVFSVLNGVMVKVSDKFKPPDRILLPVGWTAADPSHLISYQYDFSKERQAISIADDERIVQQRQHLDEEERLRKERDAEEERLNAQKNEAIEIDNDTEVKTENQIKSSDEVEILTPFVLPAEKIENKKESDPQRNIINIEEFENQNQNPFELVELQTLNEFDELRNVLEPNKKHPTVIKSKAEDKTENDFELDVNMFAAPEPVKHDENTTFNLSDTETSSEVTSQQDSLSFPQNTAHGTLTWTKFDSLKSKNPFKNVNPFQENSHLQANINSKNYFLSHSPPVYDGYNRPTTEDVFNSNLSHNVSQEITTELHRTKSLPNLQEQCDDYENVESIKYKLSELNRVSFNKNKGEVTFGANEQLNVAPPQSSDRVANIMKQFQFQRINMGETQKTQHYLPPMQNVFMTTSAAQLISSTIETSSYNQLSNQQVNSSSVNYVMPYTGFANVNSNVNSAQNKSSSNLVNNGGPMLIQSAPTYSNSASNMHSASLQNVYPIYQNVAPMQSSQQRVCAVNSFGSGYVEPTANTRSLSAQILSPIDDNQLKLSFSNNADLHTSPLPPLPNIPLLAGSVNQPVARPSVTSWLIDETSSLSTNEKSFAMQLEAMGFERPCVSRAIKRLGRDEKEVLDFLCLVQEFKEKSFASDDIEVALINNQNDKEKVGTYLQMVSTFKELGFQPKNVHAALKETSCDQNKVLDYLTR